MKPLKPQPVYLTFCIGDKPAHPWEQLGHGIHLMETLQAEVIGGGDWRITNPDEGTWWEGRASNKQLAILDYLRSRLGIPKERPYPLMHIYVEAVVPGGRLLDIGTYSAPVVPRLGEKILLELHSLGGVPPHPRGVLLRVCGVRYKANNHMQVEPWMTPFGQEQESTSVAVEVRPENQDAADYLARLAASEASDGEEEEEEEEERQVGHADG